VRRGLDHADWREEVGRLFTLNIVRFERLVIRERLSSKCLGGIEKGRPTKGAISLYSTPENLVTDWN